MNTISVISAPVLTFTVCPFTHGGQPRLFTSFGTMSPHGAVPNVPESARPTGALWRALVEAWEAAGKPMPSEPDAYGLDFPVRLDMAAILRAAHDDLDTLMQEVRYGRDRNVYFTAGRILRDAIHATGRGEYITANVLLAEEPVYGHNCPERLTAIRHCIAAVAGSLSVWGGNPHVARD